ncbi:hypothetical protein STEG23_006909, partial [Scotinomys teguina]
EETNLVYGHMERDKTTQMSSGEGDICWIKTQFLKIPEAGEVRTLQYGSVIVTLRPCVSSGSPLQLAALWDAPGVQDLDHFLSLSPMNDHTIPLLTPIMSVWLVLQSTRLLCKGKKHVQGLVLSTASGIFWGPWDIVPVGEHPDLSTGDVAKKLGEMWNNTAEDDKPPYEKKAAKLKEKYEEDIAALRAKGKPDAGKKGVVKAEKSKKKKEEEDEE